MLFRCDNCNKVMEEPAVPLNIVRQLAARLDIGGVVPAGECECGAFCYPETGLFVAAPDLLQALKDELSSPHVEVRPGECAPHRLRSYSAIQKAETRDIEEKTNGDF